MASKVSISKLKLRNKSWEENVLNISKYKQQFVQWKRENDEKRKANKQPDQNNNKTAIINSHNNNNNKKKKREPKRNKEEIPFNEIQMREFNQLLKEMEPTYRLETVAFQCIFGRQKGRNYKKSLSVVSPGVVEEEVEVEGTRKREEVQCPDCWLEHSFCICSQLSTTSSPHRFIVLLHYHGLFPLSPVYLIVMFINEV